MSQLPVNDDICHGPEGGLVEEGPVDRRRRGQTLNEGRELLAMANAPCCYCGGDNEPPVIEVDLDDVQLNSGHFPALVGQRATRAGGPCPDADQNKCAC
jgi:hypothetical protein